MPPPWHPKHFLNGLLGRTMLAQLSDVAFGWARPTGLFALGLPLVLWILARMRARPPSRATGTLDLWKEVAGPDPRRATRRRRGTPPATRWAIAALVLGAVALAGPRRSGVELARTWTLVIDHRPGTSLPAPGGAPRRLDAALERAQAWLAGRLGADDLVRYCSPARATLVLPSDERPPSAWLAHPAWASPAPRWELFDAAGTLWVSDVAPALAPEEAGLFTSGAEPVPGAVAAEGRTRLLWDGERVAPAPDLAAPRSMVLGSALPEALRALAGLWAQDRGLVPADERRPDTALVLEAVVVGEPLSIHAGRDGWVAAGTVGAAGVPPFAGHAPQEAWLTSRSSDGTSTTLVRAKPGEVRVAWLELAGIGGDPAAFAVSWSRLLDASVRTPPDVVALLERERVGAALERGTQPPRTSAGAGADPPPRGAGLDAVLALAAALLGAVAVSTAAGSVRAR